MPSPTTTPPRQRRRASKPRSATGCMTCRIRRVKCDEGEPTCRQCLRGRRICDGYRAKRPLSCHQASQDSILLITPPLSPRLFNIEQEHHCFDFFRHRTVPRLSSSFESHFWNQLLLQATHHEPAIRHAAVALGSLHEHFELENTRSDEHGGSFALQQYLKAIELVAAPIREKGKQAADVALMTCVLFVSFETLRGYNSAAMSHINGGVKIVSELQSRQSNSALCLSPIPYVPLPTLHQIFSRLDEQASLIVHGRPWQLLCQGLSTKDSGYDLDIPASFDSLESARNSLDYIRICAVRTAQTVPYTYISGLKAGHVSKGSLEDESKLTLDLIRSISIIRLKQWSSAFESLLQAVKPPSDNERRAISVLKLARVLMRLNFSTDIIRALSDEMIWDEHLQDFESMISHGEAAIDLATEGKSTFTLDTEVVFPLHFAAMKCRDGRLRRKAIALLRRAHRQEGVWNSLMVAEFTERMVEIEEEGLVGESVEAEDVSKWKRISGNHLVFDTEHRKAAMKYTKLRADGGKDTIIDHFGWDDRPEWRAFMSPGP